MTEAFQPAPQPVAEAPARLSIKDVMQAGKEAGREQRVSFFDAARERINSLKKSASNKWNSFRDSARSIGKTVVSAVSETSNDIGDSLGVVTTKSGREALGAYGKQELNHARETASTKIHEAGNFIGEKAGQLSDMARAEFDTMRTTFNEDVKPAVIKGAKVAAVVVTSPIWVPVVAVGAAAEGAAYVGGKAIEAGGKLVEAGIETGREIAGKVSEYVGDRVEDVQHHVAVAKLDVSSTLDQLAINAAASETKIDDLAVGALKAPEYVGRKFKEGINWFAEKFNAAKASIENRKAAAEQRKLDRQERLTTNRALKARVDCRSEWCTNTSYTS